jgi:hypothetical protein
MSRRRGEEGVMGMIKTEMIEDLGWKSRRSPRMGQGAM